MSEIRNMEKWNTAKDLAKHWGKTTRTINGWWNTEFRGVSFDANAKISPEREALLYEKYVQPREEKAQKGKRKKTPRTYTVQPSAPEKPKVETGRTYGAWIKSDWFLVAVMLICLSTQIIHSAGFFFHNSPVENPAALHIGLSILFALGIDLVALVMTAHNGSRVYLYIYAGIHFVVNLLFHIQEYLLQAFIDLSLFEFCIKALGAAVLSLVLAFSLFSYVELFTKGFKK